MRRSLAHTTKAVTAAAANRSVMPAFAPQLATLVSEIPEGKNWLYEIKFDGYRILCRVEKGKVALLTRNAQDWTPRLHAIAEAALKLSAHRVILDGEAVALGPDGSHSFQLLQNYLSDGADVRLVYHAFDLLYLDDQDLRALPLLQRKQRLQALLAKTNAEENRTILFSEHWTGSGRKLLARACAMGLEGIIAKRGDEPYQPARTRSWLKIKCSKSQEFVIGGYTDPAGARIGFGALLLGVNEDGRLRYTGRVGTGFDGRLLRELRRRFDPLHRQSSPFSIMPKSTRLSGVHWLEPELVCEVVFTGWTTDGLLRHPSFKGLRDDKPAREVRREFPTRLSD